MGTKAGLAGALACLVVFLSLGCSTPEQAGQPRPRPLSEPPARTIALAPARPAPVRVELGRSVEGRPIEALVFGQGGPCTLVVGGIHGDEPAGSALVERLGRYLEGHPDLWAGRQVVLVPAANPDGLAAGTRTNARGVDVNRNFPAANFSPSGLHGRWPLSEPESRALEVAILTFRPSTIVSVHGPLGCVDPDGPPGSYELARQMAQAGRLPVVDLPALPGSLGSYGGCGLGLTMVTYELESKHADPAGWDGHIAALLMAVRPCK